MAMQWDAGEFARHWIDKLDSGTDAMACLFANPENNKSATSYLGNRKGIAGGGKLSPESYDKLKQDFEGKQKKGLMPIVLFTIVLNENTGFHLHGGEKLFERHTDGVSVMCETIQWTDVSYPTQSLETLRRLADADYKRSIKPLVDELVTLKQIMDMGGKVIFNQ